MTENLLNQNEKSVDKMNFYERYRLKRQIKNLRLEMQKIILSSEKETRQQKEDLIKIIEEMINETGASLEENLCKCGNENCKLKGEEHKLVYSGIVTNKYLKTWTVEKLQNTCLKFFDELNILITENKKKR